MGDMADDYDYYDPSMEPDSAARMVFSERGHMQECRGKVVLRHNRSTGQPFWGCNLYPACKWSRSLTDEEFELGGAARLVPLA